MKKIKIVNFKITKFYQLYKKYLKINTDNVKNF